MLVKMIFRELVQAGTGKSATLLDQISVENTHNWLWQGVTDDLRVMYRLLLNLVTRLLIAARSPSRNLSQAEQRDGMKQPYQVSCVHPHAKSTPVRGGSKPSRDHRSS